MPFGFRRWWPSWSLMAALLSRSFYLYLRIHSPSSLRILAIWVHLLRSKKFIGFNLGFKIRALCNSHWCTMIGFIHLTGADLIGLFDVYGWLKAPLVHGIALSAALVARKATSGRRVLVTCSNHNSMKWLRDIFHVREAMGSQLHLYSDATLYNRCEEVGDISLESRWSPEE